MTNSDPEMQRLAAQAKAKESMADRVADVLLNWGCGTSDDCEKIARAAIEAVREPTEALEACESMMLYGFHYLPPEKRGPHPGHHAFDEPLRLVREALAALKP